MKLTATIIEPDGSKPAKPYVTDIQAVRPPKRNQTARISLQVIILSKSEANKPQPDWMSSLPAARLPEFQRCPPVWIVYGNAAALVNTGL